MARTMSPSRLYTSRSITDRKVLSTSGERLGEIQDIVIDAQRGCIAYAVLTYSGGFMRRKHFAVPWEAFTIDEAHRDLVLDVEAERLKDAPGFDDDNWPTEPDESFARDVHSYYGYDYPQGQAESRGYREGETTGGRREGEGMGGYREGESTGRGTDEGGYREGEGTGVGGLGKGRSSDEPEGGSRRF